MKWYQTKAFRVALRFARVAGATGVAAIVVEFTGDSRFLALAPVLVSLSKWLRETWPKVFGKSPV